ncbi:MAG TPA: SDR family oxidoreductase, partial [Gemmatimonadales bacterium]|nr:SDR family oxidoreductase [Gemmatimonadales bacterium]
MIDLAGRSALVTGGSRGVGRATALMLARAGADVALTYRSQQEAAESVAREITAIGRRVWIGGGDLGDRGTVDRLVQEVEDQFGGIDIFVGNAGIWPPEETPLRDMSDERWHATVTADLDAVFYSTRAALRIMHGDGAVVLVSSTAGQRGEANHADYAATKGALISLTKSLAIECAPRITVNCVAPGWIDTAMSESAYQSGGKERIAAGIPLQRIATADDVAGPIVFLCSPLARHITGEVLNINGGT